jgi:hypothetical protein
VTRRGETMAWIKRHVNHRGRKCLIWPFARLPDGRSHMSRNGKTAIPPRIMCELVHGPAPSPKHHAAHSCGNGHLACVHPRHVRWATSKENADDKILHGTLLRGEDLPQSKLTEDDIHEIRRRSKLEVQKDIAAEFGVNGSCISKIVNRVHWKHI